METASPMLSGRDSQGWGWPYAIRGMNTLPFCTPPPLAIYILSCIASRQLINQRHRPLLSLIGGK